jgi:eukaryotic-like serine/threonine-protein kinase
MSVLSFIKSKTFRNHLILAIAAGIGLLWFSLKMLDVYTMHGKTITVPDLEGMTPDESQRVLKRMNLRQVVNDSIFDSNREKGTISSQNPLSGVDVKKNRTIYLTMVATMPEMIAMPDLTDLSLRQAMALLETYGLKVGRLEHVPNIARNAVLQQKFKNGTIEPGTLIEKGTAIDLVLGTGVADTNVPVPLLIGKTRDEAINLLNLSSLNIGQEVFLDEDDVNVKVFRQSPSVIGRREFLPLGSTVDLYYRSVEEFDFEEYIIETLSVSTPDLYGKSPEDVFQILQEMNLAVGEEVFEGNVPVQNARVYRQEPDFSNTPSIIRGSRINIWYRDIKDFDN